MHSIISKKTIIIIQQRVIKREREKTRGGNFSSVSKIASERSEEDRLFDLAVESCRVSARECTERILDPGPYADRNPAYQINPRTSVIVRRVWIKCNPFMQRYRGHLCAKADRRRRVSTETKEIISTWRGFFPLHSFIIICSGLSSFFSPSPSVATGHPALSRITAA